MQKKESARVAEAEKKNQLNLEISLAEVSERTPTLTSRSRRRGIDVAFAQKEFIFSARSPTSEMRFWPRFRKSGQKRTD
ncbi:hypothetical protein [Rufibacter ruber]|uniref:hypothetical protein n=1 Tax=Rufibacter ruber TaxID=1783499 RepID=UPI00128FEE37|nr:hypothetical protein [Rufibacter ruber]